MERGESAGPVRCVKVVRPAGVCDAVGQGIVKCVADPNVARSNAEEAVLTTVQYIVYCIARVSASPDPSILPHRKPKLGPASLLCKSLTNQAKFS